MSERSQSRGRDTFHSSGRGGAGNIHASQDNVRPSDGPDDFSTTRGREPAVNFEKVYSTGRGGAGNIRSPSREPRSESAVRPDIKEQEIIRNESEKNAVFSTGRGGLGNMSRSRSRGPAPAVNTPPHVHSTGRGGSGNIYEGDAPPIESVLEDGNVHFSNSAVHSTGRGGLANMSHSPAPGVEQLHPPIHTAHHYESTGRGGAGNMRDQSASRDPASRSQSRGRVGDLLHRVTHPSEKSSREREGDNGSVQRGRTAGPSD